MKYLGWEDLPTFKILVRSFLYYVSLDWSDPKCKSFEDASYTLHNCYL